MRSKRSSSQGLQILKILRDKFGGKTLQEAFSSLIGLNREVCLMIVSLLCPKMMRELNELAAIPLEKFSSIKAVSHYLEALVKSGVAAEEDRGVIYVMHPSPNVPSQSRIFGP